MKVNLDQATRVAIIAPTSDEESTMISKALTLLHRGDTLKYRGISRDEKGESITELRLHIGGTSRLVERQVSPLVTVSETAYEGGVLLTVTTDPDQYEIMRQLRDMIFFGGKIVYLGTTEVDGKQTIKLKLNVSQFL